LLPQPDLPNLTLVSASHIQKVQVWVYARHREGGLWVLLLKTNPERGIFWQPVTGGVEGTEALPIAALREAKEETGLKFRIAPEPLDFEFNYTKDGVSFHETVFAIRSITDKGKPPQIHFDPKEHMDFRWVSPQEAFQLLKFDSNKEGLQALLKKFAPRP
jgi:dihydroneopterin triphosphate diphosphatase